MLNTSFKPAPLSYHPTPLTEAERDQLDLPMLELTTLISIFHDSQRMVAGEEPSGWWEGRMKDMAEIVLHNARIKSRLSAAIREITNSDSDDGIAMIKIDGMTYVSYPGYGYKTNKNQGYFWDFVEGKASGEPVRVFEAA